MNLIASNQQALAVDRSWLFDYQPLALVARVVTMSAGGVDLLQFLKDGEMSRALLLSAPSSGPTPYISSVGPPIP